MLELDVKVKAALTTVVLLALKVRALVIFANLFRRPPIVLLASRLVPLTVEPVHIQEVKRLDLNYFLQLVVSFFRHLVHLMDHGLVLEEQVPVEVVIVEVGVEYRRWLS